MGTCLLLLGLGMIGEVLILVVGEGELLFEFEEVCGVVLGEGGFFSFLLQVEGEESDIFGAVGLHYIMKKDGVDEIIQVYVWILNGSSLKDQLKSLVRTNSSYSESLSTNNFDSFLLPLAPRSSTIIKMLTFVLFYSNSHLSIYYMNLITDFQSEQSTASLRP